MTDPEDYPDLGGYRDVTCSFCDRHNRDVHIVAGRDGLTICQVCVARSAEAIDADTGVTPPPGGWSSRWAWKSPLAEK